jgi:hypothetical protein
MPYWSRFDICEAWYVYAMDYHKGQWSIEYEIFGRLDRIHFRPGPMLCRSHLSKRDRQNVRDILASLIRRYRRHGMPEKERG